MSMVKPLREHSFCLLVFKILILYSSLVKTSVMKLRKVFKVSKWKLSFAFFTG